MPSRIIREEILTSSKIEQLDPAAEVFYRRLLSKVDDHGLYDARPSILRASLFPLRIDRVREADCSRWMAACQMAGLIVLYSHAGSPYLKVLNTRWVARSDPKYPQPETVVNSCAQPLTDVPVVVVVDVVESVVVGPRKRGKPTKVPMPDGFGISDRVRQWAKEKGHNRLEDHFDAFKRKCAANGYTYAEWDDAFMEAIRNDWAKLGSAVPSAAQSPHAGVSPAKDETPADKIAAALAAAETAVASGTWTKEYAKQYMTEVRAKHANH
jgi:hypothetical protein